MKSIVRAPRGYKWKIVTYSDDFDVATIGLHDSRGNRVGEVRLQREDAVKRIVSTHSDLNYDLRGRGIGTKLYVRAIQWGLAHGYKVRSSGGSSEDAERVWAGKGIREYFYLRTITSSYGRRTWIVLMAK
jgi:GNAT superfamily N-acetyltransferase